MHRLDKNNIKKNKLGLLEINNLLLISMGFLNNVKNQKIKFNPKPFLNPEQVENKTLNQKSKEKTVNLHSSLEKRIDDLIKKNEEITKNFHDSLNTGSKHINSSFSNIVEIRQPSLKKPEMPLSINKLKPNKFDVNIEPVEEFFEIESPKVNQNEKEKNEEIDSWMINETDAGKTLQGVGKIKIRYNNKEIKTQPKEDKDITKTKLELELTKKEIEAKKIALEKAIKEEKQKEEDLKKIEEIKLREEKLKKLETKKKQKEEKIKQRKKLKLQKQREKEVKKQEKLQMELIKKEKEEKIKQMALESIIKEEKQKEKKQKSIDHKEKNTDLLKKELGSTKKGIITDVQTFDQDVAKLLPIIDSLFDKLPADILEKFAESKDFEIYEKVMLKYTNKV